MKRAFSYARVSSEGQIENYSISTQQESMRQYAKDNDIDIVREFTENGVTGAKLNRPALNELRDKATDVDTVIFFDPDRMSRNLVNQIILKDEFDKAGIELAFVKGGLVGNTPEDKMLFNMRGVFAEYELTKIAERTIRGRRQRIKNGLFLGGKCGQLYGYDLIDGKREINPETGKVVRQIYEWYLEGDTMANITVRLHSLGIKSPSGQDTWSKGAIFKMLGNRAYTGRDEVWGIEINQPELVSLADFEKVQLKLGRNKELARRNGKRDYLLSGFIFCSECNRRYIGSASHNRRYYNCPNGSQNLRLHTCNGKSINADSLETIVWLEIEKALSDPDVIMSGLEAINDHNYQPELDVINTRIKHYGKERQRCWQAFEITGDTETFKEQIKRIDNEATQLNKRYSEIEGLVKNAEQTPKPSDINTACKAISRNIGNLTYSDRRLTLEALKVKVHAGNAVRIEGVLPIELTSTRGGHRG